MRASLFSRAGEAGEEVRAETLRRRGDKEKDRRSKLKAVNRAQWEPGREHDAWRWISLSNRAKGDFARKRVPQFNYGTSGGDVRARF